ncbi:peptide-methionine (S)-S-oxide reductase MsrA [Pontibacter cellulosilyticus]|uniref:Peptide methionine sulfoxide reductase MsrA n=1 Tax=Pontibacter cellulosilyticus TaxID=1720253 RepID=A0A923N569_9BACT|nr:peptide-methionine (S)-S-oxide reductase MsrA [Pontibacter cellulosilyticus]MBC5991681.1 peptide-methionine (S)-S-oxide reductase MsrA [Pontibacter cellulosilyticus]
MAILSYLFLPLILLVSACSQQTTDKTSIIGPSDTSNLIEADTAGLAKATFAGGCFWCTEAYFERVQGVKAVISGYAGGTTANPTYAEVSAGNTDFAEAVQVYYNPDSINYEKLVEVFFATHDPTTLNRQGPDVGEQYRSVAFYRTADERRIIEDHIQKLASSGKYKNKIVTYVQPLKKFWPAEQYHQDYYVRNPSDPYVVSVAKPKVEKFEKQYSSILKPQYDN